MHFNASSVPIPYALRDHTDVSFDDPVMVAIMLLHHAPSRAWGALLRTLSFDLISEVNDMV